MMHFNFLLLCFVSLTLLAVFSITDTRVLSVGKLNEVPAAKEKHVRESQLNMTVFYESLCPDCVNFFRSQFTQAYFLLHNYINVFLVPYGNAEQTRDKKGHWQFTCQHGEDECFYNRIQVCAIASMIKTQRDKLYIFLSCYMSIDDKKAAGQTCSDFFKVDYSKLLKCANSKIGFDLLALFGNVTHSFRPQITSVPTVVFNNKYNDTENTLAAKDLLSLLCQKLNYPEECKQYH